MLDMDRIDFVIAICEADMALSSAERETLCELLWHTRLKGNRFVRSSLPVLWTFSEELEVLELIKEKASIISEVLDRAEFNGDSLFRSNSCTKSVEDVSGEELYFWIGLCYTALAADHRDDPIGKKLEQAELECLKQVVESRKDLEGSTFVSTVIKSVEIFKSHL
ncbi:MAG: hypothetical protein VW879_12360 [Opitutae bacterium]